MINYFGRGGGLWPAGAGRRVPYPLVPVILACRRGSGGSDRLAGAGRWPLPRPVGEGGTPTAPSPALVHARGGGYSGHVKACLALQRRIPAKHRRVEQGRLAAIIAQHHVYAARAAALPASSEGLHQY